MQLYEKYLNEDLITAQEFLEFLNEYKVDESLYVDVFDDKGNYFTCIDLKVNSDIEVIQEAGVGGPISNQITVVIYHKGLKTYFKVSGYYDSWNGSSLSEWKIVNPVKRLVTEYESNQVEPYIVKNFLDQKDLYDNEILKLLNSFVHKTEDIFDTDYVMNNYASMHNFDIKYQKKYNKNLWQKYVAIVVIDNDKVVLSSKSTGKLFRANVESRMNEWNGYDFTLSDWYLTESYIIEKTFYE